VQHSICHGNEASREINPGFLTSHGVFLSPFIMANTTAYSDSAAIATSVSGLLFMFVFLVLILEIAIDI
jgi:hypothetical protein